jgi:hypothetical protein
LQWSEDVKPNRRGDQSEGEPGETRDQRSRKGGEQENRNVSAGDIHGCACFLRTRWSR